MTRREEIYAAVIAAMQEAEELEGVDGDEYALLMEDIAREASRRRATFYSCADCGTSTAPGTPDPHVCPRPCACLRGSTCDVAHDPAECPCGRCAGETRPAYVHVPSARVAGDVYHRVCAECDDAIPETADSWLCGKCRRADAPVVRICSVACMRLHAAKHRSAS